MTAADRARPVVAAIDVGSNSIKLTVARLTDGRLDEFHWATETVRLGEGIEATGALAEERMGVALDTLRRFAAEARTCGAERVRAVGTEALRVAANGPAFLARVAAETGIETAIIDGDREAALTFAGLAATIDVSGTLVVADIGGASTEVIVAGDGAVVRAKSVPIGSGRLTDRFVRHDPPTAADQAACRTTATEAIGTESALVPLPSGPPVRLVLVGGTGEYLARLAGVERGLSPAAIDAVLEELQRVAAADLATRLTVAVARARVLPAGIAIAAAIADLTRPGAIDLARSGIRTGLLLEAFGLAPTAGGSADHAKA